MLPHDDPSKDPLLSFLRARCAAMPGKDWRVRLDPANPWIHVRHARAATPEQGWKLHLSATLFSAEDVLRRALPVLLSEPGHFKAATLRGLQTLNEGGGGLSQIGKFLTIYPQDEAQAVRLAAALDEATRGGRGPVILSDQPLRPGSLVHYRYGGFGGRRLRTLLGENLPAIQGPDGTLIPDRRGTAYDPPAWAADPFHAAGVSAAPIALSPLIGGRYLRTTMLHQSPRGAVFLAVDTVAARPCVLKQARRDAALGRDGRDAQDRLRHEGEVLARLAPDARFPAPLGLESQDGDLYLVLEDVEGETLETVIARGKKQGVFLNQGQLFEWAQELVEMLGAVHDQGYVYRDLKSSNVLVATDGHLRLLDFEIAQKTASAEEQGGRGTRGYMSPQQTAREAPHPADDIYSLGAVLFFLATGAEPSQAPQGDALLARPLRLLNPDLCPAFAAIIARCLAPDLLHRFPSLTALSAALETASRDGREPSRVAFGCEEAEPEEAAQSRARFLARALADTICREAEPLGAGPERFWRSRHATAHGTVSWHLNSGGGGTLLALAELVSELGVAAHTQTLVESASGLRAAPFPAADALPGLYVGEAGAGAALLRAGQVLGDDALCEAAAERGGWVARQPFTSPDLFHGTAGRLRFHLWLWQYAGRADDRAAAVAAGESLLASREDASSGKACCWRIPPGFGGLSGTISVGYAHGAAGIADALLDLFDVTGEERFRNAARQTAGWLCSLAQPSGSDGLALSWPSEEGRALAAGFWCHGAAGVGRFFLHAAQAGAFDGALDVAARAARSVARGTRWAGSTQCHGLAGSIEFLLDMYQATRDDAYLREARSLGRLLEAFASQTEHGLAWPSESPAVFTPDYMVGYAGVAVCLLRLAAPERLPRQLTSVGFRSLTPSPL